MEKEKDVRTYPWKLMRGTGTFYMMKEQRNAGKNSMLVVLHGTNTASTP